MEQASSVGSEPPVSGSVQAKWSGYGAGLLLSGLSTGGHNLDGLFQLGESLNLWWAFLMVQMEKNPPAMQEIWVRFLDQEDPLEKRMATHSSILA